MRKAAALWCSWVLRRSSNRRHSHSSLFSSNRLVLSHHTKNHQRTPFLKSKLLSQNRFCHYTQTTISNNWQRLKRVSQCCKTQYLRLGSRTIRCSRANPYRLAASRWAPTHAWFKNPSTMAFTRTSALPRKKRCWWQGRSTYSFETHFTQNL